MGNGGEKGVRNVHSQCNEVAPPRLLSGAHRVLGINDQGVNYNAMQCGRLSEGGLAGRVLSKREGQEIVNDGSEAGDKKDRNRDVEFEITWSVVAGLNNRGGESNMGEYDDTEGGGMDIKPDTVCVSEQSSWRSQINLQRGDCLYYPDCYPLVRWN